MNRPTPILPSRTGAPLTLAAAIALSAYANKTHIAGELRNWPNGKSAETIIKAATTPATMTGTGWADSFAMTAVADFVSVLAPASAGSVLLKHGLQFQFSGAAAIAVPSIVAAASGTSFVKEADPIPVRQFNFSGPSLSPRKFATLSTFTREIFEHSKPTIELLVRATLIEDVGLALDGAMFGNTAGDATRPPGLLVGISGTTPSANTDHNQACIEDAATLAAAVSVVAANGEICFVCSPKQAVTLRLRTYGFPYLVLASSALADKTVLCFAASALASATDPLPRFALSDQATIVERDDPAPISTSGAIAVPTRSLWQTDTLSLKMVFEMSWVLRHASGLAWMSSVLW